MSKYHSPLFSVVIPLYNKVDTIERTLRSVAAQSFRDYEVVVVDDGSKDAGADIVAAFTGIERLRVVRQENAGVSVARNNGANAAEGKYIAFLDADDEWMPTFLEEINRLVSMHPEAKVLGTGYERRSGKSTYICRSRRKPFICDLFKVWPYFQPMNSSSIVIEKGAYHEVGGYPTGISFWEDGVLWFKLASKHLFYIIRKPLSRYNDDAQVKATGSSVDSKSCRDRIPHLALLERKIQDGTATESEVYCATRTLRKMMTENILHHNVKKNLDLVHEFPDSTDRIIFGCLLLNQWFYPLGLPLAIVNGLWIRIRVRLWFKKVRRG